MKNLKNLLIDKKIKQFTKKYYPLFLLLFFIALYFKLFIVEKLPIYKNYNYFNKQEIKIVSPVKNIPPDSIENTYGAPRPGGRVHEGIDLFASFGDSVYSVADGFILYIGRDNLGGNVIKLMGEDNRIYYYAHLSRFADYKNGDEVEADKNISR